jgi:hypothetical protein
MVIDLFYFNGEHEVLDARLAILSPYVDKFIVCEAEKTFSGVKKKITFDKAKYPQYNIELFIMSDTPEYVRQALKSPNTGNGEHYWVREWAQKESVREALEGCSDNDFIFISDVDEIWNPKCFMENEKFFELILGIPYNFVYKPKQLPYLCYFNQRTSEDWLGWTGTIACKYRAIKDGVINHLRTDSMTEYTVLDNGGWHFNAIGGKDRKKKAFAHPVYDDNGVWNNREVNMRKDESDLPQYLLDNKEKYAGLFL